MMLEEEIRLRATATHEAAHAVCCKAQGVDVAAICIDARQDGQDGYFQQRTRNLPLPEYMAAKMVSDLVGGFAELRLFPSETPAWAADKARAEKTAWELVGRRATYQDVQREITAAEKRAMQFVEDHWQHIEAVAEHLLQFKVLCDAVPVVAVEKIGITNA